MFLNVPSHNYNNPETPDYRLIWCHIHRGQHTHCALQCADTHAYDLHCVFSVYETAMHYIPYHILQTRPQTISSFYGDCVFVVVVVRAANI